MRDIEKMSRVDLSIEIMDRKVKAFDKFIAISKWTTQQLSLSGYLKPTDALNFAHKINVARTADWEKFHG